MTLTLPRRLIMSSMIATVALSALSLSFTLAWYASSDRLNVSAFDIQIVGSHSLLISTAKELDTFKEDLEKEELNNVDLFVPASTMYKDLWMNEKSDTPLFYDTSFYNVPPSGVPQVQTVNRGYFQQKLYLLSDITYNVTLSVEDTSFLANEQANLNRARKLNEEDPEFTVEEYFNKLNNLAKCVRLSILVPDEENYSYFIVDPYKEEGQVTRLAGRLDNDNDGYYDTYEFLQDNGEGQKHTVKKETMYGEVLDRSKLVYDDPSGEPVVEIPEGSHYKGNSFNGLSRGDAYAYNEEKTLGNGKEEEIFAIEDSMSMAEIGSADNKLLIPCEAGVPKEIVVSIYLEGWDKDCINATMGASFIDKLSFKLAKGGIE